MSRAISIDDERLLYIWNRFREKAVSLTKALAFRPDGMQIAHQLVNGFKTKECRSLLKQFRAQYDRRNSGSDQEAAKLRSNIIDYLANYVSPRLEPEELRKLLES